QLAAVDKTEEAARLLTEGDAVKFYNAVSDAVDADAALNDKYGNEEGEATIRLVHTLLIVISVAMVVTILMCAVIGSVLTRLIVPPLQSATTALEQLANKDLTAHVEAVGEDEVGRLSAAINSSVGSMREVLRTLTHGAETLSAAA